MDNLEFLDGSEGPKDETQPEKASFEERRENMIEAINERAAQERDEHGRFKAKEAESPPIVEVVTPTPEPQAQEPVTEPKPAVPPGMVPVDVVQALREEIKQLKQAPPAQQQPQEPQPVPDMFEDPEGYQSYQNRMFLNHTLNTSERFAAREHGRDTVDQAKQWMAQKVQTDPYYAQAVLTDPDPYEKIVTDYRRETALSKIGDLSEIDQFLAWKQAQAQVQQPQATTPQQPAPSPSIASAPSAGGPQTIATGPGIAFDETIK